METLHAISGKPTVAENMLQDLLYRLYVYEVKKDEIRPLLLTEEITKAVINEMKAQNILAGNFYWYDNNWHYIRKWDHLKNTTSLHSISNDQQAALKKLQSQDFSVSDAVMSRCVSTAISLLWTEEQIRDKGEKIVSVIKNVLSSKETMA